VNMDSPVVGDVAELAEVIHKLADARAGGADHVGELLLSDGRYHAFGFSRFTELSHDKQCAGEAFLAVVKQLVDEILPGSDPAKQDEL